VGGAWMELADRPRTVESRRSFGGPMRSQEFVLTPGFAGAGEPLSIAKPTFRESPEPTHERAGRRKGLAQYLQKCQVDFRTGYNRLPALQGLLAQERPHLE